MRFPVPLLTAAALPCALLAAPCAAQGQDGIPASGVFKSGEELYAACTSGKEDERARCDWFLMAAHDMATYYADVEEVKLGFCLSTGTKAETLRAGLVAYLRDRPASRKYSAVSTFLNAMDAAHPGPCKR